MSSGINLGTQLSIHKMLNSTLFDFPIVDLRSAQAFSISHLRQSASFPVEQLEQRTHELPTTQTPLNLVGDSNQLAIASEFLCSKGYRINAVELTHNQQFDQPIDQAHFTVGDFSQRLWQPSSVVEQFCEQLSGESNGKSGLDLACGAGRDSLYLASLGWQMTAVDLSQNALERLKDSASRSKLKIHGLAVDLEKNFEQLLGLDQTFDLVLIARYLHRPLLQPIKTLINPSGYLVYQTFMQGCEIFGSPKNPRFLLKENELAEEYSDFNILMNKVEHLPDGRPTICFIAQKKHD